MNPLYRQDEDPWGVSLPSLFLRPRAMVTSLRCSWGRGGREHDPDVASPCAKDGSNGKRSAVLYKPRTGKGGKIRFVRASAVGEPRLTVFSCRYLDHGYGRLRYYLHTEPSSSSPRDAPVPCRHARALRAGRGARRGKQWIHRRDGVGDRRIQSPRLARAPS